MPNQDPIQSPQNTAAPADPQTANSSPVREPPAAPPVIFPQSDLPPFPPAFQDLPKDDTTNTNDIKMPQPVVVETPGSSAPPDVSSTIPKPKKKFGGGKIIATILGLVVLVGGVGAGIILTRQQQILKPRAENNCGAQNCDSTEVCCLTGCKKIADGGCDSGGTGRACPNSGDPTVDGCVGRNVGDEYCSAGTKRHCTWNDSLGECVGSIVSGSCACLPNPHGTPEPNPISCGSVTCDGCTQKCCPTGCKPKGTSCSSTTPSPTPTATPSLGCNALCVPDSNQCMTINGVSLTCYESTSGNRVLAYCRNASCLNQTDCICPTVPPIAPSCIAVKAYDASWAALSSTQLSALTAGDTVNFCVNGSGGTFDKAQFEIGTTVELETSTIRPGTSDFCQSYTILSTDTTVTVLAKIHDQTTNTWVGENF